VGRQFRSDGPGQPPRAEARSIASCQRSGSGGWAGQGIVPISNHLGPFSSGSGATPSGRPRSPGRRSQRLIAAEATESCRSPSHHGRDQHDAAGRSGSLRRAVVSDRACGEKLGMKGSSDAVVAEPADSGNGRRCEAGPGAGHVGRGPAEGNSCSGRSLLRRITPQRAEAGRSGPYRKQSTLGGRTTGSSAGKGVSAQHGWISLLHFTAFK